MEWIILKIKENKGSFSLEGTICSIVFTILMLYALLFLKLMWIENLIDDSLLNTSKKMAVLSPLDNNLYNYGFELIGKEIFIKELEKNVNYLKDINLEKENINFKYSKYDVSGNKILLTVTYNINSKIFGLSEFENSRNLIFSKMNLQLKFMDKDKLGETVYITNTGCKYHKENCRYLYKSKIAVSEEEAKSRGYTKCKKCYGNGG